MVAGLGEVIWIVDFNRQSLDRITPASGAGRFEGMFAAAGWQVITVKYGALLNELFGRPGGDALRRRIDEMANTEYQRLLRYPPPEVRGRLCLGDDAAAIAEAVSGLSDDELHQAIRNLGGHDIPALREAFASIDDSRPSVIFAYTIKGFGLASEGHPQNHSALLTSAQLDVLAGRTGTSIDQPWATFDGGTPEFDVCATTATRPPGPRLAPSTSAPNAASRPCSGAARTATCSPAASAPAGTAHTATSSCSSPTSTFHQQDQLPGRTQTT